MARLWNLVVRDPRGRLTRLRRRVTVNPLRTGLQKRRAAGAMDPGDPYRELLRAVDGRIHPYEDMYTGDGRHYFGVGVSAIRCIDDALRAAGADEPATILDLPCGFGRVTRSLAARFPHAEITASDIRPAAVAFCERRLGARGHASERDLGRVGFAYPFDLIWCGSLLTHLDAPNSLAVLDLFARSARLGGMLVFTTGGDGVASGIVAGETTYMLTADGAEAAVRAYRSCGYGYADYPGNSGYGISVISPKWVTAEVEGRHGLHEIHFEERGWDSHQDVFAFVKT